MGKNHADADAPPSEHVIVDARGLNCPLPVLKLRKRLLMLPEAARVELLASDRATLRDVPAFCAAHGYAVAVSESGGELQFLVTRQV